MKNVTRYLTTPVLLHYALPVLMIYLVAGTVAQKYIGLFEATRLFFSSFVLWYGPIPLPGFPFIIGLIFINLTCKLVFKSPWKPENAGIIITHIGAILLLLGGLFTALFSTEGYVDLAENESKTYVSDFHIREFVLLDQQGKQIQKFKHQDLVNGDQINVTNLPIEIEILETCRNCKITAREKAAEDYYGMAKHMQLSSDVLRQDDEDNMGGVTFRVNGTENDGVYVVLENVPELPALSVGNKNYKFALRQQQRALPFTIELLEFRRQMHPGTDLAKAYQSRVLIKDNGAEWESLISMNEPLRYKGYTLFQSSFVQTPQGDISVLAVVWNAGRVFPYISGIALCVGLIVHLSVRRRKNKKGQDIHVP